MRIKMTFFESLSKRIRHRFKTVLGINISKRDRFEQWRKRQEERCGKRFARANCNGFDLMLDPDDPRAHKLYENSGSQKHLIDLWRELLATSPELVIDVGANYGEFSVVACDLGHRLLAIEPNPIIVEYLKKNLMRFRNFVICSDCAGDDEYLAQLFVTSASSGFSSLSENIVKGRKNSARPDALVSDLQTKVRKLDNILIDEYGTLPNSFVLKIDVEGFEPEVFRGCQKLLRKSSWFYVILEFDPKTLSSREIDIDDYWEYLRSFRGMIIESKKSTKNVRSVGKLPEDWPNYSADILLAM